MPDIFHAYSNHTILVIFMSYAKPPNRTKRRSLETMASGICLEYARLAANARLTYARNMHGRAKWHMPGMCHSGGVPPPPEGVAPQWPDI